MRNIVKAKRTDFLLLGNYPSHPHLVHSKPILVLAGSLQGKINFILFLSNLSSGFSSPLYFKTKPEGKVC